MGTRNTFMTKTINKTKTLNQIIITTKIMNYRSKIMIKRIKMVRPTNNNIKFMTKTQITITPAMALTTIIKPTTTSRMDTIMPLTMHKTQVVVTAAIMMEDNMEHWTTKINLDTITLVYKRVMIITTKVRDTMINITSKIMRKRNIRGIEYKHK